MADTNDDDSGPVSKAQLQAAIIEQEHRLLPILTNFWYRTKYAEGDPRRTAATHAFLWRVAVAVMPGPAVAVGGGLIALLGLFIASHANWLLLHQNESINTQTQLLGRQNILLETQNSLLTTQNQLAESNRRSQSTGELSAALTAVSAYIEDELRRGNKRPGEGWNLPDHIAARIVSLSSTIQPYRYAQYFPAIYDKTHGVYLIELDNLATRPVEWLKGEFDSDGKLNEQPLSPERAHLLVSLCNSGVNVNELHARGAVFDFADLRFMSLKGFQLRNAKLRNASLVLATIEDSELTGADLMRSDVRGSSWRGCTMDETRFWGAQLNDSEMTRCTFRESIFPQLSSLTPLPRLNEVTTANHFHKDIVYTDGADELTALVTVNPGYEQNGKLHFAHDPETEVGSAHEVGDGWKPVYIARPAAKELCVWRNKKGEMVDDSKPLTSRVAPPPAT